MLVFALRVALTVAVPGLVLASTAQVWEVVPEHSVAHVYRGQAANAQEVGVVRVSGEIIFDSKDAERPRVHLNMRPDNEPQPESVEMDFTSTGTEVAANGLLMVSGDLSVIRRERTVNIDANEAYRGPEYGETTTYTETRSVILTFSRSPSATARAMQYAGAATITRSAFPQLFDAISVGDWPTLIVNDEQCTLPATIAEDYSGIRCTGVEVDSVKTRRVATGVASGEGFYGFSPEVAPDHNSATVDWELNLVPVPR